MRSVLFGLNVFIGAGLLILSSSAMAEDCNLPTCKNKAGYYQDASKEVQKQQTLKDQPVQAVKDLKSEKENKTENNPAIVKSQFPKLGATPVAQGTPPVQSSESQVKLLTAKPTMAATPPVPQHKNPPKGSPVDTSRSPGIFSTLTEQQDTALPETTDTMQRVLPEVSTRIVLSNSDVNRVICPEPIKDAVYSTEKGIKVTLTENNGWVKFLVMKKDGHDLYASSPVELYLICGDSIYSIIAVPKRIPSQTVMLSPGKSNIKKNMALMGELPLEKRVISLIKSAYTDSIPDSFTVINNAKSYTIFTDLDVMLKRSVVVEGEGLQLKEFHIRLKNQSQLASVNLKEKDFLKKELTKKALAVSIDLHNLTRGELSRVFVVERTGGDEL